MSMTAATVAMVSPSPIPDDMATELRAIARRRAVTRKRVEAEEEMARTVVIKARDMGCSLEAIGALLGMSHVAVAKLERRARKGRK